MFTKAKFFNLALQALLLTRQISDPASDKSNEAKCLNEIYDVAFRSAIADMDLNSTSIQTALELIERAPTSLWLYSYKYPHNCAFFRRVVDPNETCVPEMDDRFTHNPKTIRIKDGKKCIFTNVELAVGEFIPTDFPLQTLSASAGLCIALRIAYMAAPLIVGKGAKSLMQTIAARYVSAKAEAQEFDARENFSFQDDATLSEFVKTRLS